MLDVDGEVIDERMITNHQESLRRLSLNYSVARIAFEDGSHSPWIKRLLTGLGHEVFVANRRKLCAIQYGNGGCRNGCMANRLILAGVRPAYPVSGPFCLLYRQTVRAALKFLDKITAS